MNEISDKDIMASSDTVNKWPQFAEEIKVNSALRDAISKTFIHYAG
jgi:hypothetical protein